MFRKVLAVTIVVVALAGCASVPMESTQASNEAKQFSPPAKDKSGLYIYRDSFVGKALKKDIWVDGKCIGESAPDTFFYEEVAGNQEHTISTESEFSPNDLVINTDSGQVYFIRQYIKLGIFVGGAGLELMDQSDGMDAVSKLALAKGGTCSK